MTPASWVRTSSPSYPSRIHTYLIFVDENNKLILSRRLNFDPSTQVTIAQCLYDIQTLPAQAMDASRFQQAAQWHMQNFSLDQVK